MKKRNILMCGLISFALFMGFTSVEAKTYTTYNVGDEITVNLNDKLKEKFLVIENNSDSVKAIYKGTLGEDIKWPEAVTTTTCTFDGSVVDQALKQRTATWTNVTDVTLPTANDIVREFDYTSSDALDSLVQQTNPSGAAGIVHLDNLTGVPFYALNNAEGTKFFTKSTVSRNNSTSTDCEIYVYGYAMTDFPFFYVSTHDNGSIRPIITVSKENVVGGSYVSENETIWNNFVAKYKTTEFIKTLIDGENITSTDSTLKILFNDGTNTLTTNFTYADGVVEYVPSNNEDNAIVDSLWVINCIYALAELKGYDIDKLSEWLDEDREYTLAVDGIELKTEEFTTTDESEFGESTLTIDKILSFKLDIKNGLKTFSNKVEEAKKDEVVDESLNEVVDEVVENPKTGDATRYIILSLGTLLVIGTLIYMKIRKYSKFPQA